MPCLRRLLSFTMGFQVSNLPVPVEIHTYTHAHMHTHVHTHRHTREHVSVRMNVGKLNGGVCKQPQQRLYLRGRHGEALGRRETSQSLRMDPWCSNRIALVLHVLQNQSQALKQSDLEPVCLHRFSNQ